MTRARGLTAGILLLLFFAILTGIALAYTVTYTMVLFLLGNWLWVQAAGRGMDAGYRGPRGAFTVGETYPVHYRIRNRLWIPVPYCELLQENALPGQGAGNVFSLPAHGEVQWHETVRFYSRGRYSLGPVTVTVADPFGLFQHSRQIDAATEVMVYPRLYPLSGVTAAYGGMAFGETRQGRIRDVPPDVATVRRYDSADGIRRIHWRSSARAGRLMSRSFDTQEGDDLHLVLDLRAAVHVGTAPESSLEYAVSLAASLADVALRRGMAVSLQASDAALTYLPPQRGAAQRQLIFDFLAVARDDGHLPLADAISNSRSRLRHHTLCIISADPDPRWCDELLASTPASVRHQVIFVDAGSFGAAGAGTAPLAPSNFADVWIVHRGDAGSFTGRPEMAVVR